MKNRRHPSADLDGDAHVTGFQNFDLGHACSLLAGTAARQSGFGPNAVQRAIMLVVTHPFDAPIPDVRHDDFTGTTVHIVGHRQTRPTTTDRSSSLECPFCPGGLEAPTPYETKWFVNRWPAMPDSRCEVVLYTPDHDASFAALDVSQARAIVDLWSERTEALGNRDDVDYVLVFENRGAEVGATISHPHGQIYAYDHLPDRPRTMFSRGWRPDPSPQRSISTSGSWQSYVHHAPVFPVAVTLAPIERVGTLIELDDESRTDLARALIDTFSRLDRLFDSPLPYMMWINQRPFNAEFPEAWMSIEIVSPWRSRQVARYIAAAEVGAGEYFVPIAPEEVADTLRGISR